MDNTFNLEFDKTAIILAGRDYGVRMFKEQLEGRIDYKNEITLIFPDHIKSLASSFIQGFFLDFKKHIGLEGIERQVVIEDNGRNFKKRVLDNLV